ncbi:MAG: hypothetical protein K0R55_4630 [Sporomusa sp.]|nr:hypothetical protein [Sporomusa sp.]
MDRDTVLFSGYAQLPSGTVSSKIYKVLALVVVVDLEKGTILEAECTLSTRLSECFVKQLLVGKSLRSDLAELVEPINARYQGSARKTIISALRIIIDKYLAFVAGRSKL